MIRKYFTYQIAEIQESKRLQYYGVALSFAFLLVSIFWYSSDFHQILAQNVEPICWPFFHECSSIRFLNPTEWLIIFFIFGFFSFVNAVLFFKEKIYLAYVGLFSLGIIAFLVTLMDYRTHMNQNIMIFFTVITFLLVKNKEKIIPMVIVSFYFWAGILKLCPEWISGEAIYKHLWLIPDNFKAPAAVYALILELILVWGLLSKNPKIKYFVLFNFFFFHFVSTGAVGFYYPMLMFFILSIFFLPTNKQSNTQKNSLSGIAILITISFFNIWPYFLPGDLALTGEARFLALHMFDTIVYCQSTATIHWKNQEAEVYNLPISSSIRTRCNPILYLSRARYLCQQNKMNPNFIDIDLKLISKRISEKEFRPIIDIKNFCQENPEYSVWGFNSWINRK